MRHRFYVSLMEGDTAASAEPVLATGDPVIVQAVVDAIAKRLGVVPSTRVLGQERWEGSREAD